MPELLDLDHCGPIAWLRLNRPRARNAVNLALARELDAALTSLEQSPAIRAVILCASGPAFCAGQDLRALAGGEPEAFIADRGWAGFTARARTVPVIAAVDGPAVGGGFELVLACDLVVASTRAWFALPEVRHGLIAAAGGAARLPLRLPPQLAVELLLTGSELSAERAAELGLVNRLVAPGLVDEGAQTLAEAIVANPSNAVLASLQVAQCARVSGEAAAQKLAELRLAELLAGPETTERIRAFAHGSQRDSPA
jgi:enoyl-CoA hydratase/carnithine racemase